MLINRPPASFVDVVDRVLDRGIVVEEWARLSLAGLDLVTVEARLVVASIETHLQHADPFGRELPLSLSRPTTAGPPGGSAPPPGVKRPLS